MQATADADDTGLRPASTREQPAHYLRAVWDRRQYMLYVARSDLRSQRMTTFLGNLWHLLNPALQITISYIIFGLVLGVDRGVDNFIAFLAVGIFPYQFTQRSTLRGAKSVTSNIRLIKSFVFPRLVLPLTSALGSILAYLSTILVMLAVPLITGEPILATWAVLPAIIALHMLFATGLGTIASRAAFHVPDLENLLPFLFRLGFYASGVIFLVDAYVASKYRWLFVGNPMYCFVALYRWAVLGYDLDSMVLPSAVVWTVSVVIFGFFWFRQAENRYARG